LPLSLAGQNKNPVLSDRGGGWLFFDPAYWPD
jgi:hypothetical protein